MEEMITLEEVVDFAINRGSTSLAYYSYWARSSSNEKITRLFEDLCTQELNNQGRLLEAKAIIRSKSSELHIPVRKIGEYLVNFKPEHQMTGLQALLWASIRTQTSQKLYLLISDSVEEYDLTRLFVSLAYEEGKLISQIESNYDDILIAAI